jgi:hypothetical protein
MITTEKYEVAVQIPPSMGGIAGKSLKVEVDATGVSDAIVQANKKLDDNGIDRWDLLYVSKVAS